MPRSFQKIIFSKKKKNNYLLVIPNLNEGSELKKLIKKIFFFKINNLVDILVVDGGSNDNSIDLSFLKKNISTFILIKNNTGLSRQLQYAYSFSKKNNYFATITIDGNGKDDPRRIINFIKKIDDGYDFVQGSRFVKGGKESHTPLLRIFAIKFIHAPMLSLFSGFKWTDTTQGFRCYKNILFKDNNLDIFRNIFSKYELLAYLNYKVPRLGYSCVEIPTNRIYKKNIGAKNSKIKGVFGYCVIFKTLLKACLGFFDK
jgi:dolichol-phosphate mannosyltransferase